MDERFIAYIPTAGSNVAHAEITSPTLVKMMIRRAKKPILILGENLEENEKELISKLIEKFNLKTIKTPEEMNLMAIMKYLASSDYDLALFTGITYYYLAQAATHLKQFSNVVTISIDKYYQPNTLYSFPNLSKEEYLDYLRKLLEG
ncbi:acetyl-CoA decarbonylase/synthase, subunit epsilon (cdhB) [Methanocaldococcus jannaschii DSM 2661]|uniref:Acetyl-CoA decarbonylase/synthase complex subunit epsilon n=1 Tax=Methanocaldococcus jannaschii (strain ATCC 43067 / DSM 2661 / JAL-1 / JCM 10045 / NBRC 100440) TaxID=243232 RepID=ACDE_METJA|nr:CO dehydrogenase/acetyl-CoA synthase complex subunit epsilon [Methanocaldococcus jannaschii]P81332.1 RecName: Full=Acetyl-CoA decarbonylase/synthase complex subunit epsilon; Short=ACDS complex subunit epsilon; AltName: Full=ACDS complex carbon monoxide dehydrogenase subunit epsilon; Short=ACDS CODH subunit epsilon [Methanocaldococcus jannaschii DSM 2661]AAB98136.1 acetyl-CoA decarbonylase/synthase, subunit epsilon (cdhB) [Methanocaldococcus jannaschii DSM 2661]